MLPKPNQLLGRCRNFICGLGHDLFWGMLLEISVSLLKHFWVLCCLNKFF